MNNHHKKQADKYFWPPERLALLDICRHIYKHAEEYYLYLSDIHREHRDIAKLWGLLAIDKCNHSDTFKMACRLKGDGISDIRVHEEAASRLLARMKSIPRDRSVYLPSVEHSLQFSVKMEESLSRVHFSKVVRFHSDRDSQLMASSIRSSSSILHMITEEYVNLTLFTS